MSKKSHLKIAKKYSNCFFFLTPELPKQPKQKNSCFKMWLIDQLHIKLGHTNAKLSIENASHPKTHFSYQADFFKAMPYFEISTKYFFISLETCGV